MVKIQTEVDGYRGEGIHRNCMSRAVISISIIKGQTVFHRTHSERQKKWELKDLKELEKILLSGTSGASFINF